LLSKKSKVNPARPTINSKDLKLVRRDGLQSAF
jgi:hypothetical protein